MKAFAAMAISLSLVSSVWPQANQSGVKSDSFGTQAPGPQSIKILRNGSQSSRQGEAEKFSGAVRVDPLFEAITPGRARGSLVTFDPGARTAWHTHPLGQVLIVTAGVGRVQPWGDPVDEIRKGDVVWIPPGQKHWHGAAPNSSMAHIAVVEQLNGKSVEWMEKVSDAQYTEPVRAQGASSGAAAKPRPSQGPIGDFAPK